MIKFEIDLLPLAFDNQPKGWESHLSSRSVILPYPEKSLHVDVENFFEVI